MDPVVAAFGNPLVDFVLKVDSKTEEEYTKRFGLTKNIAQECDTVATGLFEEVMQRDTVSLTPGGCSLNTCRVFQWLHSRSQPKAVFFGGAGKDELATKLRNVVVGDKVTVRFALHPTLPTGHCIALAHGQERTLCANLGAANHFSLKDLWNNQNGEILEKTSVIYVEGYFLSHSWAASTALADFSRKNNKVLAFNLCGEYVCSDGQYVKNVLQIVDKISIVFGNKNEYAVFLQTAKDISLDHPFLDLISSIQTDSDPALPPKMTVIMTDGPRPVRWTEAGSIAVRKESVPAMESIVDSVGAGDSFIAGYLKASVEGFGVQECVKYGIYASQQMLHQVGASLPNFDPKTTEQILTPRISNEIIE